MLRTFRQILSLLSRRERRRFYLITAMILVMGLFEAVGVASVFPFLAVLSNPDIVTKNAILSRAYAMGGFEDTQSFLMALGAAVFTLIVVGLVLKTVSFYAVMRFGHMRAYTLGMRLFRSYLDQPYEWFLNHHSAHLGKNILSAVDEVIRKVVMPAAQLVSYSVICLFIVGVLVVADPLMAFCAAGVIGGCYATISLMSRRHLFRIGRDHERANAERFRVAQECFGGIKYVKLMGLGPEFTSRFQKAALPLAKYRASGDAFSQMPRYILEGMLLGGIMIVVMIKLIASDGDLGRSLPVIGLYAFAGVRLFPAAQTIYRNIAQLRFGQPALDMLIDDLRARPTSTAAAEPKRDNEPLRLRDQVQFDHVHFAYSGVDRPVVDDLSLTIKANTTVGFVGKTGAGKTTIVDLLLGMIEPQQGQILIDGTPIDRSNVTQWQRTLGYVPQDIFLADDTMRGNIAFGIAADQIDEEAVLRASRMAKLHDFVVTELKQGYDTRIGERGTRLSGGQRQRVAIARALYHDPDLLVLDEATSALDSETERAVMDAVHNLAKAKTIILVAHRLSTLRDCHKIFLLDRGSVTASGTFDELFEQSQNFRSLAGRRQ